MNGEKITESIGGPTDRRMPGPAYKQKVWAMPKLLREELMDAIVKGARFTTWITKAKTSIYRLGLMTY